MASGRTAGETCSLLLATTGREPSDAAVSEKQMQHATTAGVQDSLKADEGRSHHLGDGKRTQTHRKGPLGGNWMYTLRRRNAKKQIPAQQPRSRRLGCTMLVVFEAKNEVSDQF
jgi:hypothetical protein